MFVDNEKIVSQMDGGGSGGHCPTALWVVRQRRVVRSRRMLGWNLALSPEAGGHGLEGEGALVCNRFRSLSLVSITPAEVVLHYPRLPPPA